MRYRLYIKKKNNPSPDNTYDFERIMDFNIDPCIRDFCFADHLEYLIANCSKYIVQLSVKDGLNEKWIGNDREEIKDGYETSVAFFAPGSVSYSRNTDLISVVDECGTQIRTVNVYRQKDSKKLTLNESGRNVVFSSSIISGTNKKLIEKYFKNVNKEGNLYDHAVDKYGNYYWTSSILNRCFCVMSSDVHKLAGCGNSGYSMTNDARRSKYNIPSGIDVSGDLVFISDSGNACIKRVNRKTKQEVVVVGKPMNRRESDDDKTKLLYPNKIKIYDKTVYFSDVNLLRSFNLNSSSGNSNIIKKFRGNIIFDVDMDGNIHVLEIL